MSTLPETLECACWIARQLFARRLSNGATGNLSFRFGHAVYITGSGTCFGNLTTQDFACVDLETGQVVAGRPSKELPLHLAVYRRREDRAVVHIHSPYATLWSCLEPEPREDCVPHYTPYLRMKVGNIRLVPYAPPGSPELAEAFSSAAAHPGAWLLAHHGMVVACKDLMSAFAGAEELEESCRLAWLLQDRGASRLS